MKSKARNAGIDYFRLIAAFLVAAIHTSPLASVAGTADFILTRIVARVAVPFFFMASGFFLLPGYINGQDTGWGKLYKFIKKTAVLYGIAILLYLPVNLYAGYFQAQSLLPDLLKDIIVDGTFYHLWYFPAAITGAALVCWLLNRLKSGPAFLVALALYLIGLLGDSYYGVTEQIPVLKSFYDLIFLFCDYTRNGLFFAPVFLILGGIIAGQSRPYPARACWLGLAVSSALMLAEGLCLHSFNLQRHDSMYVMLLPCMFFLFQSLLRWKGQGHKKLRDMAVIIYIIHPFMIVLVRGFAKVINLRGILVGNSMVHYLTVAACSAIAAIVITTVLEKKRRVNGFESDAEGKGMGRN